MKLGIFGGTFDPPHLGHLILAAEAGRQLGLERVLWVVTGQSPFKLEQRITPAALRVAMVSAAIADNPLFALSRVDLERAPPHYTADTVALLAAEYPQAKLYCLMGADSLHDLPDWTRPDEIIARCKIAVLRRPGTSVDLDSLEARLPGVMAQLRWVAAPQLEIASRELRQRVRSGLPLRYLTPDAVRHLIAQHGLYRAD